jgi:thioredoxin-like negative regulator of GroEL
MEQTKDENGMIPLPNHLDMEKLLRPRRPIQDGFLDDYDPYVVIIFSAKWCGPCQKLNKKLLVDITPGVTWYSVDVDINKTSLGYCGLQSIPSFVVIKDGLFTDKKSGAATLQEILLWLQNNGVQVEV